MGLFTLFEPLYLYLMGTDLYIKQQGQGDPLICLHGWGFNGEIWNPLADILATHWNVLQVDLPGHGRSPIGEGDYQLPNLTKQLIHTLPTPAVWMGWSLGGLISLASALRYPDAIKALILISTTPRFTTAPDWSHALSPETLKTFSVELQQNPLATLQRFLALQLRGSDSARQLLRPLHSLLKNAGLPKIMALKGGLELLLTTDLRPQLPYLRCPTLLYLGGKDPLIPSGVAAGCHHLNPKIRFHIDPATGHVPFLTHPQDFLKEVETFLNEHRTTRNPR